jgi:glutamine synthetase
MYLKQVAIYKDPNQKDNHILVLCEAFKHDKTPATTNHRKTCAEVSENDYLFNYLFCLEQC